MARKKVFGGPEQIDDTTTPPRRHDYGDEEDLDLQALGEDHCRGRWVETVACGWVRMA
jgi:hypothetical protein